MRHIAEVMGNAESLSEVRTTVQSLPYTKRVPGIKLKDSRNPSIFINFVHALWRYICAPSSARYPLRQATTPQYCEHHPQN